MIRNNSALAHTARLALPIKHAHLGFIVKHRHHSYHYHGHCLLIVGIYITIPFLIT